MSMLLMMDWAVDTTDLVTDVFGGVKGDQFAKPRCGHMWRKWSRRLSVSRLLYVAISSPAVCWLGQIRTVAPRFYTVHATMTCPGLMIPGHVGLCYMPSDWTSARPCIFIAAHRGSVCLARADCRTLASAAGYLPCGWHVRSIEVGLTAERLLLILGRNVCWSHRVLPPGESRWVGLCVLRALLELGNNGHTDGHTDIRTEIRQAVTFRLPLDAASVITWNVIVISHNIIVYVCYYAITMNGWMDGLKCVIWIVFLRHHKCTEFSISISLTSRLSSSATYNDWNHYTKRTKGSIFRHFESVNLWFHPILIHRNFPLGKFPFAWKPCCN